MQKKDTRDRRAYKKAYHQAHKDAITQKNKEYYAKNKEKLCAYSKEYRENHKEETAAYKKEYNETHKEQSSLRHKKYFETFRITQYGITIEDYNHLFESQGGCCAICGVHQSEIGGKLHIDHNHDTGKVRGLLCGKCNKALGLFYDNPHMVLSAYYYLAKDSV